MVLDSDDDDDDDDISVLAYHIYHISPSIKHEDLVTFSFLCPWIQINPSTINTSNVSLTNYSSRLSDSSNLSWFVR